MRQPNMNHPLVVLRLKYPNRFDAIAMLFYLLIVHVWGVFVYPLGRDYAAIAGETAGPPALVDRLFQFESWLFGGHVFPYHLVNLALVYFAMLLMYHLVGLGVRGPFWLGTLAAALLMASPVHNESILNLSGVTDLLPAVAALLSLTIFAYHGYQPSKTRYVGSLVFCGVASILSPVNTALGIVTALYDWLILKGPRWRRIMLFLVIAVISGLFHLPALRVHSFVVSDLFVPLYFTFYVIGFLPENVRLYTEQPVIGWLAAAAVTGVLAAILFKSRRRAILFALLAMLALRLSGSPRPVDPTHLIGGGQLFLPSALFFFGLAALFYRIMDHPRWRVTVVSFTTVLAAVLFIMQFLEIRTWVEAGNMTRAFQEDMARNPEQHIVVAPSWRYFDGAPLEYAEAVKFDTPFSQRTDLLFALPLHYHEGIDVVVSQVDEGVDISVTGADLVTVSPWPATFSRPGDTVVVGGYKHEFVRVLDLSASEGPGFTVRVRAIGENMAPLTVDSIQVSAN